MFTFRLVLVDYYGQQIYEMCPGDGHSSMEGDMTQCKVVNGRAITSIGNTIYVSSRETAASYSTMKSDISIPTTPCYFSDEQCIERNGFSVSTCTDIGSINCEESKHILRGLNMLLC